MKNSDLEQLLDEKNEDNLQQKLDERFWVPIEKYRDSFSSKLSDIELANTFIAINDDWFTDKANSLYGLREQSRDRLIRFLEENKLKFSFLEILNFMDEDDEEDFRITYVLTKFVTEWIDPIKGVFQNSLVDDIGIDGLKKKKSV